MNRSDNATSKITGQQRIDDKPLFLLGRLIATPGALAALERSGQSPAEFLARHASGDWGCLDAEDTQANDMALVHGTRLLSVYRTTKGVKIWIITEANRASTCILLPDEY
jgi:hypothetical protein